MTKNFSKDALIEKRLRDSLKLQYLHVDNQSAKHSGHAGDDGSGESHYVIAVSSTELDDLTRIQKHRKIFEILGEEIVKNTHSISLKFK